MNTTDIIVVGPAGNLSDELVIAAGRAGGRGFLCAGGQLEDFLARCIAVVARSDRTLGVQFAEPLPFPLREFLASCPDCVKQLLLPISVYRALRDSVQQARQGGVEIYVECCNWQDFADLHMSDIDGVILKGNESGGSVSGTTTFVLCQQWQQWTSQHVDFKMVPYWVRGGIGVHSVAAAAVCGATGVVLDSQILLARESRIPDTVKGLLRAFDGGESVTVGARLGCEYRLLPPPGSSIFAELADLEDELSTSDLPGPERATRLRNEIHAHAHKLWQDWPVFLCGQDVAFASGLAEQYVTVAGIMQRIAAAAMENIQQAGRQAALSANGALAEDHGTRFPILQGPMTRVSDVAPFADAVSAAGALPFLALALLREQQVESLLQECDERLGERPWGVGLLGFLPPEIRQEQVRAIKRLRPDFAIIAGGRPDQAMELEEDGITTYLHVPSPGLLRMFVRQGARRFILEGRECGGHVGPRSSFVLWEQQIDVLLQHVATAGGAAEFHVVFAGGIHDAQSAAMVAALAAPLVAKGVKIGVLMGTAYLFTREAVESGAIVSRFQKEALAAESTVLFETGPGHAIRCIRSPYFDDFHAEKIRLKRAGKSHRDIVIELERMNTGRLRMASKGVDRRSLAEGTPRQIVDVPQDEQFERGMYMVGQVAAMHRDVLSMEALHESVTNDATNVLQSIAESQPPVTVKSPARCDVAIIGMSCLYPGANNLHEYWDNILNRVYAVTEIPDTHWDWRIFYDENPRTPDKIISKWGGFLGDIPFDPLKFGIAPASLKSIEPLQMLMLESVHQALADAGYEHRPFDRENTCAVLGIGGGGSPMGVSYGFRTCLPMLETVDGITSRPSELIEACEKMLPEWTEDSFPGILMNVAVGRVANRFDFGGSNYAIDAACASSLAAVHACCRELELGTANVALAMGADTVQTPYAYMAFSKTHALSARGRCRPFDAGADGIVLSEGLGVVVLKRLADAERDGDKIYAVIRGVGSSSDGKDKGLTAPNSAGQLRALRRAYQKAGIPPSRVGLIEAHGTGTVVGDRTELEALAKVMADSQADRQSCALGSVKSMIGHSKCAAGVAGLIKATLALHHKILPPTLVETPNGSANFAQSALYLNTASRPWVNDREYPRCAGVSAFGFGGTNVHVVLEEYTNGILNEEELPFRRPPTELLVLRRSSVAELTLAVDELADFARQNKHVPLAELAALAWRQASGKSGPTLTILAESIEQLGEQLQRAKSLMAAGHTVATDPRGIYYAEDPSAHAGKIAMVFPGQGSQYPDMLADLAASFVPVRAAIDRFTQVLNGDFEHPLSRFIYPPSAFTDEQRGADSRALARTDIAQPAIGAVSVGLFELLRAFHVHPDFVAGHSYGEFTALWSAGVLLEPDLIRLSRERGRAMRSVAGDNEGGMAAVAADEHDVRTCLAELTDITLANLNAPDQTVISGSRDALQVATQRLQAAGLKVQSLAVSCAFHSPHVAKAQTEFAEHLRQTEFATPRVFVFSNQTAQPHAKDGETIRDLLLQQITSPVRFRDQIEAMYAAGVRTFIEVGPQSHLTGLIKRNLGNRTYTAVATDVSSRHGLTQLMHCLGQLLTVNVAVNLDALFHGRVSDFATLKELERKYRREYSPTTWIVNGIRSRPWKAEEPRLLGQRSPHDEGGQGQVESKKSPPSSIPQPRHQGPQTKMTESSAPQESHVGSRSHPAGAPRISDSSTREVPAASLHPASTQSPGLPAGVDPVMIGFQELMSQFLETQRDIMLAYLQGATGQPAGEGFRPLLEKTDAPPPQPLPPEMGQDVIPRSAPHVAPELHAVGDEAVAAAIPSPDVAPHESNGAATHGVGPIEPATSGDTMESITDRLIEIVSQRTGYPREMLNLDLDLEADLGIDSIKRVEILGELAETLDGDKTDDGSLELEKLTIERTLRGMLNYLEHALFSENGDSPAPKSKSGRRSKPTGDSGSATAAPPPISQIDPTIAPDVPQDSLDGASTETIQRAKVRLVEIPRQESATAAIPSAAIVITDDERGLAVEIADRLGDFGQSIVLLRHQSGCPGRQESGLIHADLTDASAVQHAVELVHESAGRVGGLIHLLPLRQSSEQVKDHESAWVATKSLYLLTQQLQADIVQSGQTGQALVLAVTGMGGALGYAWNGSTLSTEIVNGERTTCPDHLPDPLKTAAGGGVVGFIKCLALEWPDVMVRVLDIDPGRAVGENVDALLGELRESSGPIEVGNDGERRLTWEPFPAAFATNAPQQLVLDSSSVILLTGGARGITAKIAEQLARRYQPQLILVGRSELSEGESAATRDFATAAELKQAIIATESREGKKPDPRRIEQTYQQLLKEREIRANLSAIRAAGAGVEYVSVDVRDATAVKQLIDSILGKYHRLDGVIHGAGVIEDKLIADKTVESFDRVFGTKVDSTFHLAHALPDDSLKFVALFSSIASRFGNRGQSDYAAANELLTKFAVQWDCNSKARVFSVAWGPWDEVGMVAELAPYLTARGISLIPPELGAAMFVDELVLGKKGESEIIIAGGAENLIKTSIQHT